MHTARARESCLFCGGRGALVVRTARGGGAFVRVMVEWTEEEWLLGEKKVDGRTTIRTGGRIRRSCGRLTITSRRSLRARARASTVLTTALRTPRFSGEG